MFSTRLVIGDTVVTILKSVSLAPDKSCVAGAQAANNVGKKMERAKRANRAAGLNVYTVLCDR